MVRRVGATWLARLLLAFGCGGADPDQIEAVEDSGASVVKEPTAAASPTAALTVPSPVPDATTGVLRSVPDVGVQLGLDPTNPPAELEELAIALRSTLIVTMDTSQPFAVVSDYLERADELENAHGEFMAQIDAVSASVQMTEPEIEIAGDHAVVNVAAEGPSIGRIDYRLDADLVDGRWVFTLASMCNVVRLSGIACP